MDKSIEQVESLIKLMLKYKVSAVKMGDIEIAGVQMPETIEAPTDVSLEEDEDLLFHSAD